MENENSFVAHLYRSSEIVKEWPSWKQQFVEKETVEVLIHEQNSGNDCDLQDACIIHG